MDLVARERVRGCPGRAILLPADAREPSLDGAAAAAPGAGLVVRAPPPCAWRPAVGTRPPAGHAIVEERAAGPSSTCLTRSRPERAGWRSSPSSAGRRRRATKDAPSLERLSELTSLLELTTTLGSDLAERGGPGRGPRDRHARAAGGRGALFVRREDGTLALRRSRGLPPGAPSTLGFAPRRGRRHVPRAGGRGSRPSRSRAAGADRSPRPPDRRARPGAPRGRAAVRAGGARLPAQRRRPARPPRSRTACSTTSCGGSAGSCPSRCSSSTTCSTSAATSRGAPRKRPSRASSSPP